MRAVGVVELGIAEADLHVGDADVVGGTIDKRSILRLNREGAGIADRVAEEVGRKLLVRVRTGGALPAERREGALQLGGHRVQESGGGLRFADMGKNKGGKRDECAEARLASRMSGGAMRILWRWVVRIG